MRYPVSFLRFSSRRLRDKMNPMSKQTVRSISDTALWVAYYRGLESERTNALFSDPYARRLAGERGEQIARELGGRSSASWSLSVRTRTIDDLVLRAISAGVDTVINLAAGLDTRPYRLPLSDSLHWIEIDLGETISYKQELLAQETARCRLERVVLNLLDHQERRRRFAQINTATANALILTEGLLVYWHPAEVAALAADLHAQPHFRYWITNLSSPSIVQRSNKLWGERLNAAQIPMRFAARPEFFRQYGWELEEFIDLFQESRRLKREMRGAWILHAAKRVLPATFEKVMQKFRSGSMMLKKIPYGFL
jgi:methyltransferase (TIGR00027 family)